MFKKVLLFIFFVCLILSALTGVAGLWAYNYITRDLPNLSRAEDYKPPAVSQVLAADGTIAAEFYSEEGRRYPVRLKEVPPYVSQAFLAAEDSSFYTHGGIDPVSILRAVYTNVKQGGARQGGSTITQQVVKNLLLTPEKKLERKVKEAILSFRLESRLSKDDILQIYLNQIFFGNRAYGIGAAAHYYFHKEPAQLTLAEASILGGLPKAPSKYSPLSSPAESKRRQAYVLNQMVESKFISKKQSEDAFAESVTLYNAPMQNYFKAPFYISEVRKLLAEKFPDLNPDVDGLKIETALDLKADEYATKSLKKGLREVDKRRGWRGPLTTVRNASPDEFAQLFPTAKRQAHKGGDVFPVMIISVSASKSSAQVLAGDQTAEIDLKEAGWAKKKLARDDSYAIIKLEDALHSGDVVEASWQIDVPKEKDGKDKNPKPTEDDGRRVLRLDQTPEIEGSLAAMNPYTGEMPAIVGGYSYARSQFNRVTQSLRQPGSSFKPILYLAAIDGFKYTPSTIVYDTPRTFKVGDQIWAPSNFDQDFLGPITLRTALEKSRNLVSADLVSRIGVDAVIQYARKMGIESKLGRNLSLALGSSEVTLLEMVRAYGVFAAHGVLQEPTFITKITDREGTLIFDADTQKFARAKQVIDPNSAFIMANLMRGVVEHGTGYKVKELGRPVAGKTGTSNDEMDTWFVGYTPEWVCGVWVGFDAKRKIGEKETGGRVAAPVFLYFMRDFLNEMDQRKNTKLIEEAKAEAEKLGIQYQAPAQVEPLDFAVPDGVEPFWIDKNSGTPAQAGSAGSFLEYYIKGTEPNHSSSDQADTQSYLESPDL